MCRQRVERTPAVTNIAAGQGDVIGSIETMPEVLSWRGGTETLYYILTGYRLRLADELGASLRGINDRCPKLGTTLVEAIRTASDSALTRVITAPETTSRLLNHSVDLLELGHFLERSLMAERALEGCEVVTGLYICTALGDATLLSNGEMIRRSYFAGSMPVQVSRNRAPTIAVGNSHATGPSRSLFGEELALALDRVTEAVNLLTKLSLANFALSFTKVLLLQKDSGGTFSSGSAGQYIGLSVITNPHASNISHYDIAEAIVHEAIHSLLYMQERSEPWVPRNLYTPKPLVRSPWSGNQLPIRPFLQACFVWYGVLNFWCKAVTDGAASLASVGDRLKRAATGFLGKPLLSRLEKDHANVIAVPVSEAINSMQERVQHALS